MELERAQGAVKPSPRLPSFRTVLARSRAPLFYIALVAAWEVATTGLALVPPYLLPAPSAVAEETVRSAPVLFDHALVTLTEIVLGFGLGTVIGVVGALGVLYSSFMRSVIYPLAVFSQAVPKIALAPLFIVWFGFGLEPKVLITALICLFPVLINTAVGLTSIDPKLMELLWSLNASRWQVLLKVRIPHTVPYFFSGLQVAITLAVVGAVVAEWVGADKGLGYLLLLSNSLIQTTALFAQILVLSVLGIALFYLVAVVERVVSPHRPTSSDVVRSGSM